MTAFLSTAYLAPIQYYWKLMNEDKVCIEQHDNYVKQTYRNRCIIMSANGVMPLSIPVEHNKSEKILTRDIRIADHGNWQHLHWNSIVSAYNSTPFFEYYRDDFQAFYEKKHTFLFDFNEQLREMICLLLNIDTKHIDYTEEYKADLVNDFREIIHPKKSHLALDPSFVAKSYYQVFSQKHAFVENLSIIDLLFNMGNESLIILSRT